MVRPRMQIELNKSEIELIDKALETWEKDARSTAMMTSVFGAMLCPKDKRADAKEEMKLCRAYHPTMI